MEAGLRRYWFVFDVAPFEPNQGPGISLDGPEVWTPEARVRGGVGVTGSDESECLNLVRSRIFLDAPMPPVLRVIEDVDVSTLGEHVLQTDEYVFPELWRDLRGYDAEDETKRSALESELRREVAEGHALAGAATRAVARCAHCDDVLFAISDGRFAAVHLSYPKESPDRPPWPHTELFECWRDATAYVERHAKWA